MESFALKEQRDDHREHDERNDLLYHFELNERERTAVVLYAETIGRNLTNILKQGDAPREEYDEYQRPMLADAGGLQFQMTIPGKRHKDVGADEQQYGI